MDNSHQRPNFAPILQKAHQWFQALECTCIIKPFECVCIIKGYQDLSKFVMQAYVIGVQSTNCKKTGHRSTTSNRSLLTVLHYIQESVGNKDNIRPHINMSLEDHTSMILTKLCSPVSQLIQLGCRIRLLRYMGVYRRS